MAGEAPSAVKQLAEEYQLILERYGFGNGANGMSAADMSTNVCNLLGDWFEHLRENYTIIPKQTPRRSRPPVPPPIPRPPASRDPAAVDPRARNGIPPLPINRAQPSHYGKAQQQQQQESAHSDALSSFLTISTASDSESLPTLSQDHTHSQNALIPAPSRAPSPSITLSQPLPAEPLANTAAPSTRKPKSKQSKQASPAQDRSPLADSHTQSSGSPKAGTSKKASTPRARSTKPLADSRPQSPSSPEAGTSKKKRRTPLPPDAASFKFPPVEWQEPLASPKASTSQITALNAKLRTRKIPSPSLATNAQPSNSAPKPRTVSWGNVEVHEISRVSASSSAPSAKRSSEDLEAENETADYHDDHRSKRYKTNDGDAASATARKSREESQPPTQSCPSFIGPGGRRILNPGGKAHSSDKAAVQEPKATVVAKPAQVSSIAILPPSGSSSALPQFDTAHASVTTTRPSVAPSSSPLGTIRPAFDLAAFNANAARRLASARNDVVSTQSERQPDNLDGSSQMNPTERLEYLRTHHRDGTLRTAEDAPPTSLTTGFRWESAEEEISEFQEAEHDSQNQRLQHDAQQQAQLDHNDDEDEGTVDISPEANEGLRSIGLTEDKDDERHPYSLNPYVYSVKLMTANSQASLARYRNMRNAQAGTQQGNNQRTTTRTSHDSQALVRQQQSITRTTTATTIHREALQYVEEHNPDGTLRNPEEGPPRDLNNSFYGGNAGDELSVLDECEKKASQEEEEEHQLLTLTRRDDEDFDQRPENIRSEYTGSFQRSRCSVQRYGNEFNSGDEQQRVTGQIQSGSSLRYIGQQRTSRQTRPGHSHHTEQQYITR